MNNSKCIEFLEKHKKLLNMIENPVEKIDMEEFKKLTDQIKDISEKESKTVKILIEIIKKSHPKPNSDVKQVF